ncbi:unnamed protein product [[Candida] boidinii]|uniref:Unnamed protein product n=1 Tax=Candida boidinii TaxID=5477 RepID=A0ACB5TNX4_CANBO|nr:unnamed protein product [[Candida] boidinii]
MLSSLKRSSRDKDKSNNINNNNSHLNLHHKSSSSLKSRIIPTTTSLLGNANNNKVLAPTRAIQACASYIGQAPNQLTFHSGDFFYVVDGQEFSINTEWIQAYDPIKKLQGLVPCSYFKIFEKTHTPPGSNTNSSTNSLNSSININTYNNNNNNSNNNTVSNNSNNHTNSLNSSNSGPYTSNGRTSAGSNMSGISNVSSLNSSRHYGNMNNNTMNHGMNSINGGNNNNNNTYHNTAATTPLSLSTNRSSSGSAQTPSTSARSSGPNTINTFTVNGIKKTNVQTFPSLYGRILYDFNAERNDELTVPAGECVILFAHHDYEWYIAKTIPHYERPGLIPVSYVQLLDVVTNIPYGDPPKDIINRERLPTVEEWKHSRALLKASAEDLNQTHNNNINIIHNNNNNNNNNNNSTNLLNNLTNNNVITSSNNIKNDNPLINTDPVVDLNIESFSFYHNKYWYLITCQLQNGSIRSLCRYYEDFVNLHSNIMDCFPKEGGQLNKRERIIPHLPGPLQIITEGICHKRLPDLNKYLKGLLNLPVKISKSSLVLSFFDLKKGDKEFVSYDNIQPVHPQRPAPQMANFLPGQLEVSEPPSEYTQQQQTLNNLSIPSSAAAAAAATTTNTSNTTTNNRVSVNSYNSQHTRNSQYQNDRLSEYNLSQRLSGMNLQETNSNSKSRRGSTFSDPQLTTINSSSNGSTSTVIHQQQQQQYNQQIPQSLDTPTSASISTTKITKDFDSGNKIKLKFYYDEDIFAIHVSDNLTLIELKELIASKIDDNDSNSNSNTNLDIKINELDSRIKIFPKDKINRDAYDYNNDDEIISNEKLWASDCFTDKGKLLVILK